VLLPRRARVLQDGRDVRDVDDGAVQMKTYEQILEIARPESVQQSGHVLVHPLIGATVRATVAILEEVSQIDEALVVGDAMTLVLVGIAHVSKGGGVGDDELRRALDHAIQVRDTLDAHSNAVTRVANRGAS